MFLLNLGGIAELHPFNFPLHPIMFLLNLYSCRRFIRKDIPLHPIMFLLNLPYQRLFLTLHLPLHPIMFLLNPHISLFSAFVTSFTSHYVPIKSDARNELKQKLDNFTSHYVPIKSHLCGTHIQFIILYIPLCSY